MSGEPEAGRAEKRQKRDSSAVERLNVGGIHLDTSKDTLSQLPFFAALYEQEEELGRQLSVDSDGRVFVDRNGELLKVIVDYIRTMMRPSQRLLEGCERELRAEAEFYGCEMLLNELDGVTNPCKLEPREGELRQQEETLLDFYTQSQGKDNSGYLIDVFANLSEFVTKPRKDLRYPLLFNKSASFERSTGCNSVIPTTVVGFETRLKSIVGDWLPLLKDPAIVIAGGSVVAALVEEDKLVTTTMRDVDLFLCGVTPERADELVDALLVSMSDRQESLGLVQANVIRSKAAVTISPHCDQRADETWAHMPPLQIMLTVYKDPLEVVVNFDVDCCAVLYHPASNKVLCTPRCQRALNHRANILDTTFRGEHYEARLEKYAARGFCVAVPGLDLSQVDQRLFKEAYRMVQPQKLLLRMGEVRSEKRKDGLLASEVRQTRVNVGGSTWEDVLQAGAAVLTLPTRREGRIEEDTVRTSSIRAAVAVPHSLERLLVLDQMRVPEVSIECASIRPDDEDPSCALFHFPVYAASGSRTTAAVNWTEFYVKGGDGGYLSSDVIRFWYQLEMERMMEEALPKNAKLQQNDLHEFLKLDWLALRRIAAGKQLGFVYHMCKFTRNQTRVDLGRVRSAAQPPLATDLTPQQFETKYGIEPELTFSPLTPADYRAHGRLAVNLKLRSERPRRPFLTNVYSFSP